VPAEALFADRSRIRILLAEAGGGKSALLRRHWAEAADHWLRREPGGDTHPDVPVLVRASSLASSTEPLAATLARAVSEDLGRFGLRAALPQDFFLHPPHPAVPWLVMVDGLDEVPDQTARGELPERLAWEADTEPLVYRFVVATRPLPGRELDRLGSTAPCYTLRPFSATDVTEYARRCLRELPDAGRHATRFAAGLRLSRLDTLARTPLMSFLLCRLYAADPDRPLPHGRTRAYESFAELLYEQNTHKRIRATHDAVVSALSDRHQLPRDHQATERAAHRVREHLPELVGHLAHERLNGNGAPAVGILASHPCVRRPDKVRDPLWNAFLGELLRTTGLLVERGGDFHFLHQTFLEHHAARHATRDDRARAQVLHDLFRGRSSPSGDWAPPDLSLSHLGFLLDGLLLPGDRLAAETVGRLKDITSRGGGVAHTFFLGQVQLRTSFPADYVADTLTRLAGGTVSDRARVGVASYLTGLDGYRQEGAERLLALADTSADPYARVKAAYALARIEGRREAGADRLTALADTATATMARVYAAYALTRIEGRRKAGADRLTALAHGAAGGDGARPGGGARVRAAGYLAGLDEHREAALGILIGLADDAGLDMTVRVRAAQTLASLDAGRQAGAGSPAAPAGRGTPDESARERSADALRARLADGGGSYRDRVDGVADLAVLGDEQAAGVLAAVADDPSAPRRSRVAAAAALTRLKERRAHSARVLTAIAAEPQDDDVVARVRAATALARMPQYQEDGARLLAAIAEDRTLWDQLSRIEAAEELCRIDRWEGVRTFARLAADPSLVPKYRSRAARALGGPGTVFGDQ
jgi:hypothetical protein